MKTPRDILLQRHRAIDDKLESIQSAVLSQWTGPPRLPLLALLLRFPRDFCIEIIWPARRVWGGLAAAWLLILMAQFDFHAHAPQFAVVASPESGGFLMALHEQDLWTAEFTERRAPTKATPRKPLLPRPGAKLRAQFFVG